MINMLGRFLAFYGLEGFVNDESYQQSIVE